VTLDEELLRTNALEADAARSVTCALGELWQELAEGRFGITDWFCDRERCYLILRDKADGPEAARPLLARDREFLERGLLGESEKVLAIDGGVSISTVAARLTVALRSLGLLPGASRVPVLVAMAVHAANGQTRSCEGRSASFMCGQRSWRVVSARRPALPASLTWAEREVLGLLVEGHSNAGIAVSRQTSIRTVANQVAAIFNKLRVSGRRSLLSHLLRSETGVPSERARLS
jgi:DNA-binding CsgD family transcriptional regulator